MGHIYLGDAFCVLCLGHVYLVNKAIPGSFSGFLPCLSLSNKIKIPWVALWNSKVVNSLLFYLKVQCSYPINAKFQC